MDRPALMNDEDAPHVDSTDMKIAAAGDKTNCVTVSDKKEFVNVLTNGKGYNPYSNIDSEENVDHPKANDTLQEASSVQMSDKGKGSLDPDLEKEKEVPLITNNDQEISGIAPENTTNAACVDVPNPVGAGDTSITDDEFEVICRYSAPQLDEDFLKANQMDEAMPNNTEQENAQDSHFGLQDTAIVGAHMLPQQMMILPPSQDCQGPQNAFFQIGNQQFYAPSLHPVPQNLYHQYPNNQMNTMASPEELLPEDQQHCIPHIMPMENYQHDRPIFYQPYSTLENHPSNPQCGQSVPLQHPNMHAVSADSPMGYANDFEQDIRFNQTPAISGHQSDMHFPAETNEPCHPYSELGRFPEQPIPEWCEGMGYPEFEEPQTFVYPSIYVSTSGMITVLLKNDVSVEMTVDRTLRLVNHHLNMAVATNSRGTASVLHTSSAKVSQNNTTTDAEVNAVKAKMTTECILFGSGTNCYKFDNNYIEPALPRFTDMSTDKSVNLLFASESYGSTLIQQCLHLAGTAEYENLPKGGVIIRINGIKITQTGRGDVTVVSGPKFLKISPSVGYVRLNTHFTEMAVDKDGVLRMRRGDHTINSCNDRVILSNGKIEAGLDTGGQLKVYTLPKRMPLELTRDQRRPRPGNPRRKATALGGAS